MRGATFSNPEETYMQSQEQTAISTALNSSKVWEKFVDDVYSILKRTHLGTFFNYINNLHPNIKLFMEKENNG